MGHYSSEMQPHRAERNPQDMQTIDRMAKRIAFLEKLIRDTPVLMIDVNRARDRDEKEALKYASALSLWMVDARKVRELD